MYKERLFATSHKKCIFYYKIWQTIYTELAKEFKGKIIFKQVFKPEKIVLVKNCYIVFDDFLTQLTSEFLDMFLVGNHHKNLTIVFLTQELFYNDILKTIRRNTHFFVFLGSLDKNSVFRVLTSDLDKLEMEKFKTGFKKIMKKPYRHILYDRFPTTYATLRVKHDIMSYPRNTAIGYIYRIVKLNK